MVNPSNYVHIPDDFYTYTYLQLDDRHMFLAWILKLAKDLLHQCGFCFNEGKLIQFIATMRHFYHDLPYHNFDHAFSVAHFMYLLIQENFEKYSTFEVLALFFGCLTHDVDHRG